MLLVDHRSLQMELKEIHCAASYPCIGSELVENYSCNYIIIFFCKMRIKLVGKFVSENNLSLMARPLRPGSCNCSAQWLARSSCYLTKLYSLLLLRPVRAARTSISLSFHATAEAKNNRAYRRKGIVSQCNESYDLIVRYYNKMFNKSRYLDRQNLSEIKVSNVCAC